MKFLITILFIFFSNLSVSGQNKPPANSGCKTLDIQEITLKDTVLIKQLELFLEEEIAEKASFANTGYLKVLISNHMITEDVLRSYQINKQFNSFDNVISDAGYPAYYSFIKGKIVLIRIDALNDATCIQYSLKSKRSFKRKLEPFLAQRVRMKFPNKDGKWVTVNNFRPGEMIQIHGGKTIYIFADKNKPPVVAPTRHY